MSHNRIISTIANFLILTSCLVLFSRSAAASPPPQPAAAIGSLYAVLNEVMPKPASGAHAWVEVYVGQEGQLVYLPAIQKPATSFDLLLPSPTPAAPIQRTAAAAALDLSLWQITNETGQAYTIPDEIPPVPKGVFVLIYFDGAGPAGNDYDFSDGKIILHTPPGLLDIFSDASGQAALRQPGSALADFVAWGGYSPAAGADAVTAGLWGLGEAVTLENGFGDISDADITEPNESLGRFPGANAAGALNWANYPPASLTPGAANPIQPVLYVTPESGARVDSATLSLSWRQSSGATQYRFQLDNNADFSSPLIDQLTANTFFKPSPALAVGVYYWHISPLRSGQPGGWTAGFSIEVVNLALPDPAGPASRLDIVTSEVVLGIARVAQNKDTRLLGLDGAPEGDPTTDLDENAWDAAAPCTVPPCVDSTKYMHGNMYCVRASIRMVASFYHTSPADKLSMDRISYYFLHEWTGNTRPGSNDTSPDNDLGYNRGMYYPDEEDEAFSWALNFTYTTPGGKPSFATVKAAIDANQPVMFRRPGHMMVIDGYRETAGGAQFLHVLDPDQPPDFERWQDYTTQSIDGYWLGPAGGPGSGVARTDESSMWLDTDGDGIMNFDEVLRFDLDPFDADSDGDWVPDKKDMREYVFDNAGAYSIRSSDTDSDGLRKELDPDNDGDGSPDSCEDTNRNGKYESILGETDNFNNGSEKACVPIFDLLYPREAAPVNAGLHTGPQKILAQVSTAVPAGWELALTAADFSVTIGDDPADVLAVYPSADTTFLVVNPPTQASADTYNMVVRLGLAMDKEYDAVLYDAKAPNDEVIVLDRSGSMLDSDKIGAAKNAASAFVDFLSDYDWVGVTSFASSASTDYTLHEITDASIRTAAIDEINDLVATGTTALGQGMQQGQGLLETAAHYGHDWTLVLLSDGWENVPPYWATVAPDIVKSTVHSVALGSDADTFLLEKIALSKYGAYFYVDVDPPALPDSPLAPVAAPVIPARLPNRLADTYLAIGELDHGMQRLSSQLFPFTDRKFTVEVPGGLPEAVFAFNWNNPDFQINSVQLTDPASNLVKPDATYSSKTHLQLRVLNPAYGTWSVNVEMVVQNESIELFFTLSGSSQTTLLAAVGGDPQTRGSGTPVPIYGILTDSKPIPGAVVTALVTGGGSSRLLDLYDDGKHGDGQPEDGLYANILTGLTVPGGYAVRLAASGTNNSGEPFTRFASTGFNVRPRLAYILKDNLDTALEYAALLEEKYWLVDLLTLPEVTNSSLLPAELIIVGPDTGYLGDWGIPTALNAVLESGKPVLGLGEGGYAFFGKKKLTIGFPAGGGRSSGKSIVWSAGSDSIWSMPYDIPLDKDPLQLYTNPSPSREIYFEQTPGDVIVFGYKDGFPGYANLLQEEGRYMLWGFADAPSKMTETGKRVFVNTVFRSIP